MTRRAFTLLEVVVAVGIMGVVAVLTFATLANAFALRDILEEEDAINTSARVALDKIAKDLQLAYLTKNTSAVETYYTLFVLRDENPDVLWFATLAHQRLYRDSRESDQAEVTIWTEDDPEMKNAYALMHRESAFIDGEPDEDGWVLPWPTRSRTSGSAHQSRDQRVAGHLGHHRNRDPVPPPAGRSHRADAVHALD